MKVMADADKLRREGVDVVDFSAGEPDFPTPDNIKQAAIRAIDANFTKYTPAGGTAETKQAVVERHKAEFGTDYKPSECIITVGGKHVLFNYTQALVNPGDEVIIPVPYWVTYKDIVNYAGGKCVFVETDEQEGFTLTADMVERNITPKTQIVIINSPSNPSGAVMADAEFEKLYHITAKRGIFLLTDECYSHFLYDAKPYSVASIANSKPTVLVAGTVSKTYAMTGWRIGYGLAPEAIIGAMMKLQSHSTSNPTSIAQKAAVEALRGSQDSVPQMLAEYRKRRDFVIPRLRQIPGVECSMPGGRVLRLSEPARRVRQRRHQDAARVRRPAAEGSERGGGSRRGVRHQRSRADLVCDIDEGTGARARPHSEVRREAGLTIAFGGAATGFRNT